MKGQRSGVMWHQVPIQVCVGTAQSVWLEAQECSGEGAREPFGANIEAGFVMVMCD